MKRTFGQTLRELRQKAGITQRELASRIGMDFSYISKIENDRLPSPAADTIVTISRALNESPEQLLALTGKIPSEVEEAIANNQSAQEFLREIQVMNLTDDEWKKIRRELSRLREVDK
ncbi:helix-turn-helix domain-containing protein [Dehalococcoides mccartyi]|uniref:helix-turn-helix domain-containing protein n=1 Tax=Dehalococcoides mccartyi TaxID=61435 RepID=UPI0002B768E1|nr:helix-turn-helix transcriptional regulator [Dehalococcoides mccartyi]AGG05936.1 HTH domain-containing protein, XRE family [Dehalococcoides mccartyi DCMB5]